ncbi:MAG: DUF3263 domain-containing protein [Acidimicrobiia bacterium]
MTARKRTPAHDSQAILDVERTWWTSGGCKDHAIRDQLDISRSQYYRRLAGLLDDPRAYDYDPLTIVRLRRRRTARRKARIEGHVLGPGLR